MAQLSKRRRLGTYEILSPLGAGGMGEVYRARDLKLGRDVAIKVLPERFTTDPRRLTRLRREARLLASLNHPHIGAIYDLEDADGTSFLVLELVEGQTLAHRIARGPLAIDDAVAIAVQIGEALNAAHAKGILHRDLKPANVMLLPGSAVPVKVLDFGLAKATAGLSESPTETADDTNPGAILGTPAYMSPEQIRGRAVDVRADVWSLGVVLYEMVTGRRPFAAGETHALLYEIVHSLHQPMTSVRVDVPADLDRIVDKTLAKSPEERYQHVDELLVDLRRLARVQSSTAAVSIPASVAPPRRSHRLWVTRGLAVLLPALLVGLISIWRRERTPVEPPSVRRFSMQLGNVRPVISPDGHHVAFRKDGRLWIRDLESETPREIPGGIGGGEYYSDSAYYLTWSPDSQDLVFPAENELRRVSILQGGSVRTICTLPPGTTTGRKVAGIAWSRDAGTILFSRYDAGVYEVPAGGGSPRLLWDEKHADDLILFDTPQGRAVAYATLKESGHALMVRTPGGQTREIARLATYWPELVYASTGHILYRNGPPETPSIWAVPVSPTTLDPLGKPFLVERSGLGMSLATEGTFVYLDFGRSQGQFFAWRDRTGALLVEAREGHDTIRNFSLSPDGTRAVSNAVDGGRQRLWLYDLAQFAKTRFDVGSEAEGQSILGGYWLGDDRVYYTLVTPPAAYRLWAKPADGFGDARSVPFPEGLAVVTDRTRDGQHLVVSHLAGSRAAGQIWLWRTKTSDGPGETIDFSRNAQNELYGTLSPNDRYLAYTSDISGRVEVYVRPFPNGPGRWQISSSGGAAPMWGAAGNELFFASGNELMRVRVSTAGTFSVSLPAEPLFSHAPLVVTAAPAPRYAVSPDGKRVLTVEHKYEFREPVVRVVENWLPEFRRTVERTH